MRKYPVLSGIKMLLLVIGWIALCLSVPTCLIGVVQVVDSISSAARNPYETNALELYTRLSILFAGIGLLSGSLVVIVTGEVIKVFIDLESNTSEASRLLRDLTKAMTVPGGLSSGIQNDSSVGGKVPEPTLTAAAIEEKVPVERVDDLKNIDDWFLSNDEKLTGASVAIARQAASNKCKLEYTEGSHIVFSYGLSKIICRNNEDIKKKIARYV
jgi:hypothetical protein